MKVLNIHNHSDYSVFDGVAKIKDYAKEIVNNPDEYYQALCMSEHGTLHGQLEAWSQAKAHNLKYMPACEYYVEKEQGVDERNPHILLFGLNQPAYRELIKINNEAVRNKQIFGKKQKKIYLTIEQLCSLEHLHVAGACIGGYWNFMIASDRFDKAEERFVRLHKSLGDRFWVELQTFSESKQKQVNEVNLLFAEKYGVKTIITSDAHVVKEEHCKFINPTRAVGIGISLKRLEEMWGDNVHNTYFKTYFDFIREGDFVGLSKANIDIALSNLADLYNQIEWFDLEREQTFKLGDIEWLS